MYMFHFLVHPQFLKTPPIPNAITPPKPPNGWVFWPIGTQKLRLFSRLFLPEKISAKWAKRAGYWPRWSAPVTRFAIPPSVCLAKSRTCTTKILNDSNTLSLLSADFLSNTNHSDSGFTKNRATFLTPCFYLLISLLKRISQSPNA